MSTLLLLGRLILVFVFGFTFFAGFFVLFLLIILCLFRFFLVGFVVFFFVFISGGLFLVLIVAFLLFFLLVATVGISVAFFGRYRLVLGFLVAVFGFFRDFLLHLFDGRFLLN